MELLLPDAIQEVLAQLDDADISNLRCNHQWLMIVDKHRNVNYWKQRLVSVWPEGLVPDECSNWRQFYAEARYLGNDKS
jgi:hypothetical protein